MTTPDSSAPDLALLPGAPDWAPELWQRLGATPTSVGELVAHLHASGHDGVTAEEVEGELEYGGEAVRRPDGVVGLLAAAEGVVLTHVVTAEELELGVLVADGDLDLWARLADEGLPLADGGEVRTRYAISGLALPAGAGHGLAGPSGWLAHLEPGAATAVRLVDGRLQVEALDALPAPDAHPDQLRALSGRLVEAATAAFQSYLAQEDDYPWPGATLSEVVADLVVDDPAALREPVLPLGVLVAVQGLERSVGTIGVPGVPLDGSADDLDAVELSALVTAHSALVVLRREHDDRKAADALLAATVHEVALASVADAVELDPLPEPVIDLLLATAEGDDQQAAALVVGSRSADAVGDHAVARTRVDEAARLRPDHPVAVWDAAAFAAAAGQVQQVDALLRRLGVDADDPVRIGMRRLLVPPPSPIGRNRPCPCGSGRKHKVCCLRDERHPLPDRAELVWARLLLHSQRAGVVAALERFFPVVDEESEHLAIDLAVFAGGVLDDYVRRRGHLLPDDELDLLRRWAATPLQPYEVQRVEPHHAVTLRPLLGGEAVVLHDRAFSSCGIVPLDLLVARPVWNGDRDVLLALPMLVHRMRRAALLAVFEGGAADPDELAAFFGPQPPPTLRTRDGERLVMCEAVYEVPDPPKAWSRLADALEASDDDPDTLLLLGREVADGGFLHRGSVSRDGATWAVSTSSRERMAELHDLVRAAAPDARLVEESQQDADELLSRGRHQEPRPAPTADLAGLSPAEQAALLEEVMLRHEERWVDESVPALGNLTPREAARSGGAPLADLEAVLDDMAWMRRRSGGGMDPDRIRRALALPARN